jgi:hypothetical protein
MISQPGWAVASPTAALAPMKPAPPVISTRTRRRGSGAADSATHDQPATEQHDAEPDDRPAVIAGVRERWPGGGTRAGRARRGRRGRLRIGRCGRRRRIGSGGRLHRCGRRGGRGGCRRRRGRRRVCHRGRRRLRRGLGRGLRGRSERVRVLGAASTRGRAARRNDQRRGARADQNRTRHDRGHEETSYADHRASKATGHPGCVVGHSWRAWAAPWFASERGHAARPRRAILSVRAAPSRARERRPQTPCLQDFLQGRFNGDRSDGPC